MTRFPPAPTKSNITRLRVEGMDCPGCAGELERALVRLPDVYSVKVSFNSGSVEIACHPDRGPSMSTIETQIRNLGFFITTQAQHTRSPEQNWKDNNNIHQVTATGLLLAIATLVGLISPQHADLAWTAAAGLSLLPFIRQALTLAGAGSPFSVQMLMTVAATGALVIGAAGEAATVVFLFSVGELLESVAAGKARRGIHNLVALMPRTAIVDNNGEYKTVDADTLVPGHVIIVRAGDRVPADGILCDGPSTFDQSPITGESIPVAVDKGTSVYAGSINTGNPVRVRVEKTADDTTIARIIHLVEEARSSKAPFARLIDRFSARYTPVVMTLACIVIVLPPLALGESWDTWIYRGLSLLLIACPCALVLSTPTAIASGISAAARHGILLKGGGALEAIGKIRTIAFDKTGTLTSGTPQVTDIIPVQADVADVLRLAAAVESHSSHPLASAIIEHAKASHLDIPTNRKTVVHVKQGIQAEIEGRLLTVGSPRLTLQTTIPVSGVTDHVSALESQGKTVIALYEAESVLGLIAVRDELRPDAGTAVRRLNQLGAHVVMLTGDSRQTAEAIAGELGIDVRAELLPEDKLKAIQALKSTGSVAMVGDGINDAPALAVASVGIAMGGGTDVALETADVALLGNNVEGVADLVILSRATIHIVWQNIAIALGLKILFLGGSIMGITTLWMAIFADTGATVLVTLNALRLLGFRCNTPKTGSIHWLRTKRHNEQDRVASA